MPFIQPNSASVQEKLCPRFGDSLCIDASGISFCERWAETVKDLYAHFVSGEKQAKEALHTAMVLRGKLSPSANVQDELQDRIGDAMAILSLPAQRLLKYKAFLEELGRDEETESIKIASRAVEAVVTEIRTAKEARRLEDAKAELFAALDEPDQVLVRKCGELLRFEDAATTVIEGTTQENPLTQLYHFSRAVILLSPAKQQGASRHRSGPTKLCISLAVPSESLRDCRECTRHGGNAEGIRGCLEIKRRDELDFSKAEDKSVYRPFGLFR